MAYVLGLDAGATKTHCLVGDAEGKLLGFGAAGCGNYEISGVAPAREELRLAISAALAQAELQLEEIDAAVLAVAGADLPEDLEMLELELVAPLLPQVDTELLNDAFAGLRSATHARFGIVVSCGTGCICAGYGRGGRQGRVGGFSEFFGDVVTGPSIGQRALQAIWQSRDGILGPTRITPRVLERAQLPDADALFMAFYRQELTQAALEPLAPLVFGAAFEGDPAACDILTWAGDYLGRMAAALIRQLHIEGESFPLVASGSVFKGSSPVLIDAMMQAVHRTGPRAQLLRPSFEPVVGAYLLALDRLGGVGENVSHRLHDACERFGEIAGVNLRMVLP